MIVKCQRPLSLGTPNPPVLIYNESRSFETMLPFTDLWESLFDIFGIDKNGFAKAKFYTEAHLDGHILVVDKPLERDLEW